MDRIVRLCAVGISCKNLNSMSSFDRKLPEPLIVYPYRRTVLSLEHDASIGRQGFQETAQAGPE